jgi:ribosomal protein L11 methyltransferase
LLTARFRQRLAIIEEAEHRFAILEVCCAHPSETRRLQNEFGGSARKLPRNWQRQLLKGKSRKPIRVGDRLMIATSAWSREEGKVLVIPAATAFGTGEHVTTALSLRALDRISRGLAGGWTLLDAGTGTGILALAARCFGATRAVGIDIDPCAVATAKKNAQRNKIRGVHFYRRDVRRWGSRSRYDVVTANLFSELLIQALPRFATELKPAGFLVLSGIMRAQEREVLRALRDRGFHATEIRRRGKWIALVARLKT